MPIRDREEADVAACAELLERVHLADHYPCRWPADPRTWLSPAGLLVAFVAVRRGELQGHVALVAESEQGARGVLELSRLFVSPERRRTGVGAGLVDAAVDHARKQEVRLVLEVVDDRPGARAFYERRGWRMTGRSEADWLASDGSRPTLAHFELAAG